MDDREMSTIAVHRAEEKLGFITHLMMYLIVSAMLAAINLLTNPQYLWFVYPVGGWGIAVLIHATALFTERTLKERLIENEIRPLRETK